MSLVMKSRFWAGASLLATLGALAASASPGPAPRPRKPSVSRKPSISQEPSRVRADASRATRSMTVEEARTAVAMLGDVYQLLLEQTHATYHNRPSDPVAATVLRKLQTRMSELGWPRSRFLAVNAVVMHPDHVPRDAFERRAVEALRGREERVEQVIGGQLRVATVTPTSGRCASCHWTLPGQSSKAAITWTAPLRPTREQAR